MHIAVQTLANIREEDLILIVSDIREEKRAAKVLGAIPSLGMVRFICSDAQMVTGEDRYEQACINIVANKILNGVKTGYQFNIYLFLSHGAWQPKNRIVRYNKLWKSFRTEYNMEPFAKAEEVEIEVQKGIRYAAVAKLDSATLPTAIKILTKERAAVILLNTQDNLTAPEQVRRIFNLAFPSVDGIPRTRVDWSNLIQSLCPENKLLLKAYGGAEEGELSLNLIGTQNALSPFQS